LNKPLEASLEISIIFASNSSAMEDDRFGLPYEEEVKQAVQKFERMRRNNENYFFDVVEFESIIDYYIECNNPTQAYEAASMATEQHPHSVSIQIRKARVLLEKGRAVEALRILKKLEHIEPGNHEIYIAKGTAMGMLGDIQGARKTFDYALSLDSDDAANILFQIVSVLQNLNYYEQLIPYLLQLIEKEPRFKSHLYDLAYAYEKIEDFEKSIEFYLRYLEAEPFSDSAWYNLGIIYNKLDQSENAMEAYDYALAINSENTFAVFNKANILSNLERYQEAIPVYLEYLESEPDGFEAMTYLAECYERTDNIPLAKKYYHEAIDIAPEFADPWFGLGVIELNSGSANDAIIYFRKAVRLDDDNPENWYLLGKAQYVKDELKAAMTCFREALKLDIYYDEVWIDLCKIILKEKLAGRAVHYLEHSYKVTGDVPGINYVMASLYLHTGDVEKACHHLTLAAEIDSEVFAEYSELFPGELLSKKIQKVLKAYRLS
jgi:tetratricopeptide (TPR) repeat protein